MKDDPEFIFVDESGDPGAAPGNNPIYLVGATSINKETMNALRLHLASFRYHHGVTRELKDWGALLKGTSTRRCLDLWAGLPMRRPRVKW
jgi:hypothetical protein